MRIPAAKLEGAASAPKEDVSDDALWAMRELREARAQAAESDTKVPLSETESLLQWHWANLEYGNGTQLCNLSNRWWDADDEFDFGGTHHLLPEGYGGLLEKLLPGLDVRYSHSVESVMRTADSITVEAMTPTGKLRISADKVICTLPLGVLKTGRVRFEPSLKPSKKQAIQRLGFGTLNKVLLVFERAFWEEAEGKRDFWGVAARSACQRGEAFQFWNMTRCNGKPMLLVLFAGRAAKLAGSKEEAERAAVGATLRALRAVFGEDKVPKPVSSIATRWEHDAFSCGTYSHIAVGASTTDYDVMAEPEWGGRLLFAGEATCRQHPATVAGAYISGRREAARISCDLLAQHRQHAEQAREQQGERQQPDEQQLQWQRFLQQQQQQRRQQRQQLQQQQLQQHQLRLQQLQQLERQQRVLPLGGQ